MDAQPSHPGAPVVSFLCFAFVLVQNAQENPAFLGFFSSGGDERNFRKILYFSRSLTTSEGVPLDLLIGDLQDLQKSLALASKYILSFFFSWVSFGLEPY